MKTKEKGGKRRLLPRRCLIQAFGFVSACRAGVEERKRKMGWFAETKAELELPRISVTC